MSIQESLVDQTRMKVLDCFHFLSIGRSFVMTYSWLLALTSVMISTGI